MLVVHITKDGQPHDTKVFSTMPDALAFARKAVQDDYGAKVYGVTGTNDPRAAKAAIEMGAAELVAAPTRKASEAEIEAERKRQARPDLQELISVDEIDWNASA